MRTRLFLGVLGLWLAACATNAAPPSTPVEESASSETVVGPVAEPAIPPATEPVTGPVAEPAVEPQPSWETKDPGVQVPDAWRSCAAPDDCQLVQTTCCDQCNGGTAVSVAKAHAEDVRAKFKATGCGGCTKRGCSTRPFCEAGKCVLQWESFR